MSLKFAAIFTYFTGSQFIRTPLKDSKQKITLFTKSYLKKNNFKLLKLKKILKKCVAKPIKLENCLKNFSNRFNLLIALEKFRTLLLKMDYYMIYLCKISSFELA